MFKVKKSSANLIIYLTGKLDVHTSSDTEEEIENLRLKSPDKDIILDMSQVEHMSSSGLRILVSLMRVMNTHDKKLKICKLSEPVKKVFEVVELMDMFNIYSDENSAIKGKD